MLYLGGRLFSINKYKNWPATLSQFDIFAHCVFELAQCFPTCHHARQINIDLNWFALKGKTRDGYASCTLGESATLYWLFKEKSADPGTMTSLTLYVPVSHVFTVLGEGILKIISSLQFNKGFSAGTAFFRVGETHSIHLPNNATVYLKEGGGKQSNFYLFIIIYFPRSRSHDA